MDRVCSMNGAKRNAYKILVGGDRPLGRPRRGGTGWIHLAEDRDRPVEGSCEHDNESSGSVKCWEVPE
jgi:hypothetical protein